MIIRIGFTQSDRANGYSSFDGYREGAKQERVTICVPDLDATTGKLRPEPTLAEVAEAVFVATNHPYPEGLTGLAGAVFASINSVTRTYLRSLSVGDTVETRAGRLACDSFGWKPVAPTFPFTQFTPSA